MVLLCLVTVVQAEPVQVYILAGQSNMLGKGWTGDLPTSPFNYRLPQDDVMYSYELESLLGKVASDGWETLRPSVESVLFGPEITFGKTVNDTLDAPIAIIKHAYGGSSLHLDWDPSAPETGRQIYPAFINHVNSSLALLGESGIDYELAGVLWTQGESDASLPWAPLYDDLLTDFIGSVRNDLGVADLQFYISRLSINVSGAIFPGLNELRASQLNVAKADPNVLLIDTDHLELGVDNVHFYVEGQMGLGAAFAERVLFGPAPGDFDRDGLVAEDDLNLLVEHWNQASSVGDVDGDGLVRLPDLQLIMDQIPAPLPLPGTGDLNEDGIVGIEDLSRVLSYWSQEVSPGNLAQADITGDGFVGISDLSIVLSQWNKTPVDDRPPDPTDEDLDLDGNGSVGLGDVDVMLQNWSYRGEVDENQPVNYVAVPGAGDFNLDGEIDADDLRFLLNVLPDLLVGDLDGDGFVSITDLSIVLANWNLSEPEANPLADPSGDGLVGIEDLSLILGNWNTGTPPSTLAVPEPVSGVSLMCLLGGGLLTGRGRWHRP